MVSKEMAVGVLLVAMFCTVPCVADDGDAKNFLTVALGGPASSDDPRIGIVSNRLEAISGYCTGEANRTSAGIHDQLAYTHSRLRVKQSLLALLNDFVGVAKAQCKQIGSSTLLGLYALERNEGASHTSTISRLIQNPKPLIAKWSSR